MAYWERYNPNTIEVNTKIFMSEILYYADFGRESYDDPSFRLYISPALVEKEKKMITRSFVITEKKISFPKTNVLLLQKDKKNWILKPGDGIVYNVFVPAGDGSSSVEIVKPSDVIYVPYFIYESPIGSWERSHGVLVYLTRVEPVWVRWKRTGYIRGEAPLGLRVYYPDGTVEELEGLQNLEDFEAIRKELQG